MGKQITAQGFLSVTRAKNGVSLGIRLVSDRPLAQYVVNGKMQPDWTIAVNQPTIGIEVYSMTQQESKIQPRVISSEWFISGKADKLTDADGYKLENNTLKIVHNFPIDEKTLGVKNITLKCKVSYDGSTYDLTTSIPLTLQKGGASSYNGYISSTNGFLYNSNEEKHTFTAALYMSGEEIKGNYTTKWFLDNKPKGTSSNVIISGEDISGAAYLRCEFYVQGKKVATKSELLEDRSDEYFAVVLTDGSSTVTDSHDVKCYPILKRRVNKNGLISEEVITNARWHILLQRELINAGGYEVAKEIGTAEVPVSVSTFNVTKKETDVEGQNFSILVDAKAFYETTLTE